MRRGVLAFDWGRTAPEPSRAHPANADGLAHSSDTNRQLLIDLARTKEQEFWLICHGFT